MSDPGRPPDNDELEGWRRALAERARETGAREACPSADEIWRAASGELDRRAVNDLLDHVAGCAHCGEALRLAGRLGTRVESDVVVRRARRLPMLAAAAGVALLLVAGWIGIRLAAPEVESGGGLREAQRSEIVSELAEGATLPRSRFVLRWSTSMAGLTYSVRVADRDLNVLVEESGLDEPSYRVPEEALARLESGAVVLWQVTGTDPDGALHESSTFTCHVE